MREKNRIKSGKDLLEAKKKHEELEMKKIVEQRRREKEEDRLAKQRVREQIEQVMSQEGMVFVFSLLLSLFFLSLRAPLVAVPFMIAIANSGSLQALLVVCCYLYYYQFVHFLKHFSCQFPYPWLSNIIGLQA